MKYDTVLKELFQASSSRLIQLFTGQSLEIVERLNIETLILQEVNSMSTSFDIRENTFLFGIFQQGVQEGIQQGIQQATKQGEVMILERQLERKFGTLPESALVKIRSADIATLELWAIRILDTNSLDEFFNI